MTNPKKHIDPDTIASECVRPFRGAATDEQYQEGVKRVREAIQHAFDLGFKAAGGVIINPFD